MILIFLQESFSFVRFYTKDAVKQKLSKTSMNDFFSH